MRIHKPKAARFQPEAKSGAVCAVADFAGMNAIRPYAVEAAAPTLGRQAAEGVAPPQPERRQEFAGAPLRNLLSPMRPRRVLRESDRRLKIPSARAERKSIGVFLAVGILGLSLALSGCSGGEAQTDLESRIVQSEMLAADDQRREPDLKRDAESPDQTRWVQEKVRKELLMLPWYGVFDHLQFSVEGDVVTLSGQVTRPTLKADAEARVAALEEVRAVRNQIEVLPLSPHDDDIRQAVYWSIFSRPGLDRYALGARPSIHIIVKNGHVTLEGLVSREGDKHHAGLAASGVSNVFSVTNNLKVESRS